MDTNKRQEIYKLIDAYVDAERGLLKGLVDLVADATPLCARKVSPKRLSVGCAGF